tara:strand:- start:94806 stop:96923 length:2118 start_codon:yes stop_codon:yes gene_type:complete
LRTTNEGLADEIQRELDVLSKRRAFGLNFERHTPEAVELPGRPVRTGDKVHILPPRGEKPKLSNSKLWRVVSTEGKGDERVATLEPHPAADALEPTTARVADLVVVAEFRDPIYPGLVSTGKVERGGDKPFHTVINSENYHALQTLLFTHRGKVDAIYIDPPYNTGAKDWKYNNDYVEGEDLYRHSKWLAFMERRLVLAKELLNPDDSVLVVTIDEKEYLRLGLLLEQIFPAADMQMVTSVVNPMGSRRADEFSRVEEYIFTVRLGAASVSDSTRTMLDRAETAESEAPEVEVRWTPLNRDGNGWERAARPNLFYPVYIDPDTKRIVEVGASLPLGQERSEAHEKAGLFAAWPMKGAREARWQVGQETLQGLIRGGWVTVTNLDPSRSTATIRYLTSGAQKKVAEGHFWVKGRRADGSAIVAGSGATLQRPRSVWALSSHSARDYGSAMLGLFLPERKFPFPKSLYAVEDTLQFFIQNKPNATVLDFFAGSGTTAHAVMRLNRRDSGRRISISVTNNEVSAEEQKQLRIASGRPGDPSWEKWGICEYITKPRIRAAITGETSGGDLVSGAYKFTDPFPMSEGFAENVEFLTLTYESPLRLRANRDFEKIAPLLWLRAGSSGRRIESIPKGWDVAESYGVIADLDTTDEFLKGLESCSTALIAFVITDDDGLFEAVVAGLPEGVEPVRLYDAYLRNFEIDAMRGAR